jgi:gamma-glutamyltranspeptidase/glutathione hydrolase
LTPNDNWGVPLGINAVKPKPPPARPDAIVFVPQPLPGHPEVAQPGLARALSVVHARLGRMRWEQLVAPAENLARFGAPVSRALARDIATSGMELPGPDGRPLREGVPIFLPDLAQSLGAIRGKGSGELHAGRLAETFAEGLGIDVAAIRAGAPTAAEPIVVDSGSDKAYFPPSEGGAYAAELFREARADRRGRGRDDAARAAAIADARAKLAARFPAQEGETATTSFAVIDWRGSAVVCSLTMGGLFGTQAIVPGTGIIAAKPVVPGSAAARSLAAMIVANQNSGQFIAGFGAGADAAAPEALVQVALTTLAADRPLQQAQLDFRAGSGRTLGEEKSRPASEIGGAQGPGLVNAIVCRDGLPREPNSCSAQHDPRGAGISVAAELRR